MRALTLETKGLLFDMDGVLISSIGSVNRCWRRWAAHYGVPDAANFQVPHGMRAIEIVRSLRPDIDANEGLRLIEDMELEDTADLQVLPGAKTLLESLPQAHWTIVTSATYRLMVGRLQAAGLPVPERLIAADMVERGKPDPEPYSKGAELLGFAPSDCVVVEDAPSGVRAGIAAGCRVLGVQGTHAPEELFAAGASWVTPSLETVHAAADAQGLRVTMQVLAGSASSAAI